jgi:hypothetical protein
VDTTSLCRSTRLHKNSEGFKAQSVAAGQEDDKMYVGRFDRNSAAEIPPEFFKENLQAIDSAS